MLGCFFFIQAEDGIRDLVRSRGLGDVYKRQTSRWKCGRSEGLHLRVGPAGRARHHRRHVAAAGGLSLIHI